jgi:hypothetical protein
MFGDWNDDDWCEFDNYMIQCLQGYLSTGLVKSKFVNLKIRQLSAETCHEFIEWCGLVEGHDNGNIEYNARQYKNELYNDFAEEYPDYGPRGKMSISRTKFYRWLTSFSVYINNKEPEEGRDQMGRWIIIKRETIEKFI